MLIFQLENAPTVAGQENYWARLRSTPHNATSGRKVVSVCRLLAGLKPEGDGIILRSCLPVRARIAVGGFAVLESGKQK